MGRLQQRGPVTVAQRDAECKEQNPQRQCRVSNESSDKHNREPQHRTQNTEHRARWLYSQCEGDSPPDKTKKRQTKEETKEETQKREEERDTNEKAEQHTTRECRVSIVSTDKHHRGPNEHKATAASATATAGETLERRVATKRSSDHESLVMCIQLRTEYFAARPSSSRRV